MRTTFAVLAISCLAAFSAPMRAETPDRATRGPLLTEHRTLQESIERIARRSALWREDAEALRRSGRRVYLLTPDQVVVADSIGGDGRGTFDPAVIAAAAPVPRSDSTVEEVLVVVNIGLIEETHRRRGSLDGELQTDLDLIVVHEVYGHAFPYLLAGNMSGRCADPVRGQRPADACAIRRENAVREELRLGRRTGYGLEGLTLARRF
jgi:hypothetical protein